MRSACLLKLVNVTKTASPLSHLLGDSSSRRGLNRIEEPMASHGMTETRDNVCAFANVLGELRIDLRDVAWAVLLARQEL